MPDTDTAPLVRSTTHRGIATVVLDSPRNRNALSARLRTELAAALAAASGDSAVRAVVLTGAGPVFCAGADLTEAAAQAAVAPEYAAAPGMADLFAQIMDAPKPVVARLNGTARAGGLGLAAAADIAIAEEDTRFAFSEVRVGVVPATISVPVRTRMADRAATRYLLTGEEFDGRTAAATGLLTEAVPAGGVDGAVGAVLESLRSAAPGAVAGTKQLLASATAAERAERTAQMAALSAHYFAGAEAAEGRAAFLAKRPPRWVL
ncbi:enoyl-CoA hydratase-related protein [Nocardiopsis coralliicola]